MTNYLIVAVVQDIEQSEVNNGFLLITRPFRSCHVLDHCLMGKKLD